MSPQSEKLLAEFSGVARDVLMGTPVAVAYAFGSRVTGSESPESDLDVGYFTGLGNGAPAVELYDELVLGDRLSRRLGVEVDFRNMGTAPLEWRATVLQQGVCVYCGDDVLRVAVERETLMRWFDEKPRFERLHEMRLKAFAAAGLRGAMGS